MATIINFGMAPPHDPMFGIRRDQVGDKKDDDGETEFSHGIIKHGDNVDGLPLLQKPIIIFLYHDQGWPLVGERGRQGIA